MLGEKSLYFTGCPFPGGLVNVMTKTIFVLFCFLGSALLAPSLEAKRVKYNEKAEKLAGLLGSRRMKRGQSKDPEALAGQLGQILTFMKQSDVSNGPMASDLIAQAYEMRGEFCPSLRTSCGGNISQQFEAAETMGLFDRKRSFSRTITRGRDLGKEVVFEHIVPAAISPEFATSLANIRIVRPGVARQSDEPGSLDAQSTALAELFPALLEEQKRYALFQKQEAEVDARRYTWSDYGMGRTKGEHEEVWQHFVDQDPSVVEKEPFVSSEVKKSKSRVGYGINELTARIKNRSQHPIEITIDFRMIGLDQLRRKASVELGRVEGNLKLLQLQERNVELEGATRFQVVKRKVIVDTRYRGWVLAIRHRGKVISHTAHPEFLVDEFPP